MEDGGGVYYRTQTGDGRWVVGTAPDLATARADMRQAQEGHLYSCQHCARAIERDEQRKRWVHKYPEKGVDPVRCYPDREEPRAFPAGPTSRDRPYKRGLWPAGDNTCGPT